MTTATGRPEGRTGTRRDGGGPNRERKLCDVTRRHTNRSGHGLHRRIVDPLRATALDARHGPPGDTSHLG